MKSLCHTVFSLSIPITEYYSILKKCKFKSKRQQRKTSTTLHIVQLYPNKSAKSHSTWSYLMSFLSPCSEVSGQCLSMTLSWLSSLYRKKSAMSVFLSPNSSFCTWMDRTKVVNLQKPFCKSMRKEKAIHTSIFKRMHTPNI